ncbi:MAG: MmcQ/YjbR family DNA-binding protein [Bacteroidota bacterium]|nr:MmcQ/YjbR family DNA-binding protein [Bacteroidota bacterium]MDX5447601.1 MmcQ/YjbR family DNA-binding protein [Bacteroidota bacterium]MDX5505119.1 MmcQ/YjbR family DNA-binding protein [Bacteroidota bacterium]
MDVESIRTFCLSLPGTDESFPFDSETLVFKVGGKMFALISLERSDFNLTLKMDPEKSEQVREDPDDVQTAYHMDKRHWVGIRTQGSISPETIRSWIVDSHALVLSSLPKKKQAEIRP